MFLLKILCGLLDFGKCLLIRLRKILPMLAWMLLLQGGLNQMMFLFLLRFVGLHGKKDRGIEYPLFCRSASYFAVLKMSSLVELSYSLLVMDVGIYLMMLGG